MIDNYDDLNRDETLAAVSDFDGEKLSDFIEFEKQNKNRKTVFKPLERQLVVVTSTGRNYVAGIWFDDVGDTKRVRRRRRVDEAIDDGLLEIV